MARPKVPEAERRRHQTKVLFSDVELERVNERRGERTIAEWLRALALAPLTRADRASEAVRAVTDEISAIASRPPANKQLGEETMAEAEMRRFRERQAQEVSVEVAEARMTDGPAQEAFIERRTKELYGQGNTSRVARRLAEAEWRARGG